MMHGAICNYHGVVKKVLDVAKLYMGVGTGPAGPVAAGHNISPKYDVILFSSI